MESPKALKKSSQTGAASPQQDVSAGTLTASAVNNADANSISYGDSLYVNGSKTELLEDILLEEDYNPSSPRDNNLDAYTTLTSGSRSNSGGATASSAATDWIGYTKEYRFAKRELMVAMDTYEQTRKELQKERDLATKKEEEQAVVTSKLKNELIQLFELETTGLHVGPRYKVVRKQVEEEDAKLTQLRESNAILFSQYRALEDALMANMVEKEKAFKDLAMSSEEKELNEIKNEVQQYRQGAYERGMAVIEAREQSTNAPSDEKAVSLWDETIALSKEAKSSWFRALSIAQFGLVKAPEDEKGWWQRSSETIKNSMYMSTVACQFYVAKRAECVYRLSDKENRSSTALRATTGNDAAVQARWRALLARVHEAASAWHEVSKLFRQHMDDVDDIFEGWWSDKLCAAVEVEDLWSELADTMQDYIRVRFSKTPPPAPPVNKGIKKSSSASQDSLSSFNFTNEVDFYGVKVDSLNSRLLSHKIELNDCFFDGTENLNSRHQVDTIDLDFDVNPSVTIAVARQQQLRQLQQQHQQQRQSQITRGASRVSQLSERQSLYSSRSFSSAYASMSEDMQMRRDLAIQGCFAEADVARQELIGSGDNNILSSTSSMLSITALAKIARTLALNNAAIKQYRDMVRFEALEDAKLPPEEARRRREDWQKRIAADSMHVFETRMLRNQAAKGSNNFVERVSTKREHLRARAILQADEAAYNAAWSVKLAEVLKILNEGGFEDW
jgi:cell division protein FtsB